MRDSYLQIINVLIATLAVALSLFALLRANQQQRRDAYFQVLTMMQQPDLYQGRLLMYQYIRKGYLPDDDSEFDQIQRALNAWDTVANLIASGVVSRRWILEVSHHQLRDMRPAFSSIVAYRQRDAHGWRPYPHLERLRDEADSYVSNLACCHETDAVVTQIAMQRGGPAVT